MRRLIALAPLLVGCATWQPSLGNAMSTAREIACTACQLAGGPTEQAAQHAAALKIIAEALGRMAGDSEQVKEILRRLEARQEEQRRDYEALTGLVAPR